MMPAPKMPQPVQAQPVQPQPVQPPPGRITLWKSETSDEWLAFMRWGSFQTCMVRPTRDRALADMTAWWREHTAEGKAAIARKG